MRSFTLSMRFQNETFLLGVNSDMHTRPKYCVNIGIHLLPIMTYRGMDLEHRIRLACLTHFFLDLKRFCDNEEIESIISISIIL